MNYKKPGYFILVLIVLLVAFRLMLPYILLRIVNRELKQLEGYTGHVENIDISLIKGAYTIKNIRIDKSSGKIPVPFFASNAIELSIEWEPLWKGRLVGEIIVDDAALNYVNGPDNATKQTGIKKSWIKIVDDLMPLQLNRFEVLNGKIAYYDFHTKMEK